MKLLVVLLVISITANALFIFKPDKKPGKEKVNGIGGIFFKSKDPKAQKKWYDKHLGLTSSKDGSILFEWKHADQNTLSGYTQWAPFGEKTTYFHPSTKDFMINFRVDDLVSLIDQLKKDSVTIVGKTETYEYGKFAWIMDPEGNKIELWEPVDSVFTRLYKGSTIK